MIVDSPTSQTFPQVKFNGDLSRESIIRAFRNSEGIFKGGMSTSARYTVARFDQFRSDLFNWCDKLLVWARIEPPTSLIIEDCSGRWVGLFVKRVLEATFEKRLPTFFIKPRGCVDYEKDTTEFPEELKKRKPNFGGNPLYVTELMEDGDAISNGVEIVNHLGSKPAVAALYFHSSKLPAARSRWLRPGDRIEFFPRIRGVLWLLGHLRSSTRKDRGITNLIVGQPFNQQHYRWRRTSYGFRRGATSTNPIFAVKGNTLLNGVREEYKQPELNWRRWVRRVSPDWSQSDINLSRRILKRLVAQYLMSRS